MAASHHTAPIPVGPPAHPQPPAMGSGGTSVTTSSVAGSPSVGPGSVGGTVGSGQSRSPISISAASPPTTQPSTAASTRTTTVSPRQVRDVGLVAVVYVPDAVVSQIVGRGGPGLAGDGVDQPGPTVVGTALDHGLDLDLGSGGGRGRIDAGPGPIALDLAHPHLVRIGPVGFGLGHQGVADVQAGPGRLRLPKQGRQRRDVGARAAGAAERTERRLPPAVRVRRRRGERIVGGDQIDGSTPVDGGPHRRPGPRLPDPHRSVGPAAGVGADADAVVRRRRYPHGVGPDLVVEHHPAAPARVVVVEVGVPGLPLAGHIAAQIPAAIGQGAGVAPEVDGGPGAIAAGDGVRRPDVVAVAHVGAVLVEAHQVDLAARIPHPTLGGRRRSALAV